MGLVWGREKAKIESTYIQRSDMPHAFSSTVYVNKKDPIVITSYIDRDPKDFQIFSSIKLGKNKFGEATVSKKGNAKYEGKLDVEYHTRHLIADFSGDWRNKYTGEVDLKWNVDKDKNQRFKANGDLRFRNSASGNVLGKLSSFDLNGHVQYATNSIIGMKSKLDLENTKKVLSVSLSTPFYRYERLSTLINFDGDLDRFTSVANVDYGRNNRIESNVKFNLVDRMKVFNVKITTPFENFRESSVTAQVEGDMSNFSGSADVTYLNNQRIIISSSANLAGYPKSASADIKTPFQGFEEVSLVANFNGYAKHFNADSQIAYGKHENIELDVNVDLEGSKQKVSGLLKTPFRRFEKLSFIGDYANRNSKHQGNVIIEYAADKKVEIDAALYLQNQRKGIQASIQTPFDGFENLSGSLNFNGIPTRFDADAELQYCKSQIIEAKCRLDIDSSSKSISVSTKTPFRGWEDQSTSVRVGGQLKRSEVEARVSYGDEKTVTFNGALDVLSSAKTLNGHITSPYPGYETQALAINVDGSLLNFQSSVTVESSQLHKPVLARVFLDYSSPVKMDATFTFTSAIRNAETLKLSIKNSDDNQCTSSIEAKWAPRKKLPSTEILSATTDGAEDQGPLAT